MATKDGRGASLPLHSSARLKYNAADVGLEGAGGHISNLIDAREPTGMNY
jgi:hypothetical protein